MIDTFGRLPVHERQWIRHVIAVPGPAHGLEFVACVVFMGDVNFLTVFQHEIGHALDFYKNGQQSSNQSDFLAAVHADTCVPDDYANQSKYTCPEL